MVLNKRSVHSVGNNPVNPIGARQLNRALHTATELAAVDKTSAAMLEPFLRRHRGSIYAACAQARLEELKRVKSDAALDSGKCRNPVRPY